MRKPPKFSKHFNREFVDAAHPNGQMVHTSKDYVDHLKKRNQEPYRGEIKRKEPRKYTPSTQCHEMVESLRRGQKPGDRYLDTLNKMGMAKVPDHLRNKTKGGYY